MAAFIDLSGQRFGRLVVLHRVPHTEGSTKKPQWVCQCDCGTIRIIEGGSLRRGMSTSCGCFQREDMARRRTTHGHRALVPGTPAGEDARVKRNLTYSTWSSMRSRCLNPNAAGYQNYGGRGIKICEQWDTFDGFLASMGERPEGQSLDRLDVNGDYTPDNCRWATHQQQMLNRRTSISSETRRAIAAYVGTGVPQEHIARKFNVARRSVRRILREAAKAVQGVADQDKR